MKPETQQEGSDNTNVERVKSAAHVKPRSIPEVCRFFGSILETSLQSPAIVCALYLLYISLLDANPILHQPREILVLKHQ